MIAIKQFFGGFKVGVKVFGETIAIIINSALLLIVYVIGVGLTSIVAKVSRKHFLETKISKERGTYWSDLNLKKRPIKVYYRQF